MKYVEGNLIDLAKKGEFDVITHGCNCFCTMGAGLAVEMAKNFECHKFPMEDPQYKGDINKLGTIDYKHQMVIPIMQKIHVNGVEVEAPNFGGHPLVVANSYTQYYYGRIYTDGATPPVDYDAITLCMRKINHLFPEKRIGLPLIGAGLAGGDWNIIEKIIEKELKNMDVTIVKLKK